jgi:alanine dehydrogenase
MMAENAPLIVAILAATAVNLRHAMYSASLAPHLGAAPLWQRALVAYLLVDQTYGAAINHYALEPGLSRGEKLAFFFGVAAAICPWWYVFTVVGAVAGSAIPAGLALDFAVPVTFIALFAPALRSLPHLVAAFVSVVVALLLAGLPYAGGLLIASLVESVMRIGCPKEIKVREYRVGLTPTAAREAIAHGHEVLIEAGAGAGSGFADADYAAVGARIAGSAEEVFAEAGMIVKVKEPQAEERARLREGQILFTYLHLAPDPEQTRDLLAAGVTAIAYETVTDRSGGLPLLAPMSEVAGKLAPQVGAWALQKANGGRGVLMGGVPGVGPAKVAVIGGGVVGTHAARVAAGMGAEVTVLDMSLARLRHLDEVFGGQFRTRYASGGNTAELVAEADMVIGAVLIPGAEAPKLVSRAQLSTMKPGAAIVDVAIDQGGCFETSRPTTHDDPIFEVDGIVHYCVANMPGAVARTATIALGNATMPFLLALADKGWRTACAEDPHLLAGLNTHAGHLTYAAVGRALGIDVLSPKLALKK